MEVDCSLKSSYKEISEVEKYCDKMKQVNRQVSYQECWKTQMTSEVVAHAQSLPTLAGLLAHQ